MPERTHTGGLSARVGTASLRAFGRNDPSRLKYGLARIRNANDTWATNHATILYDR